MSRGEVPIMLREYLVGEVIGADLHKTLRSINSLYAICNLPFSTREEIGFTGVGIREQGNMIIPRCIGDDIEIG